MNNARLTIRGPLTAVSGDQHFQTSGEHHSQIAGDQTYSGVPKGTDLLYRHSSYAALLDASARPKCLPGTREAIIVEIMGWIKSKGDSPSILWLRGPVGTGKTALAHTILEPCMREGLFIGSFFFSKALFDTSNGKFLIPTLALQLVTAIPETKQSIIDAIRNDPHLVAKTRKTQLQSLVVEPLKHLSVLRRLQHKLGFKPFPRLLVIDGLDECSDSEDVQQDIIKTIGEAFHGFHLPIRILVSSRAEPHIVRAIEDLRRKDVNSPVLEIDLKTDALVHRDIRLFFETKFKEVRQLHSDVPDSWPSPEVVSQLVDKASGQFIYASTLMAYITTPYNRPQARLDSVLGLSLPFPDDRPTAQLDLLYSFILRMTRHLQVVLSILALLVVAAEQPEEDYNYGKLARFPSVARIESILHLQPGDAKRILYDVHSLVDCQEAGIKILDASFTEYLTDQSRQVLPINFDIARATFRKIRQPKPSQADEDARQQAGVERASSTGH